MNLKLLGDPYQHSVFKAHNLKSALDLIEDWEKKFNNDNEEGKIIVK